MEEQITVVDLARIKNIIEIACSRGAFQASEVRAVGEVYERLDRFLSTLVEQAKTAQSPSQENSND
jgi:hypothetical protein